MLELQALEKSYASGVRAGGVGGQAVRALDGVTLTIDTGLFGLLGPNGAGKSTLMRTVATLQTPDAGRVLLDGRDAHADPQSHRRRLGYLPQEHGVYPGISALDLLDHLAVLKGVGPRAARRAQVELLLQRTHLWEHRRRAVATYSGGMRRRFGIAQALLGQPRLVIVDEPTAGLDPEERARFHELLVEVGESVIVLLSTHIVADVEELCTRMAVLAGGRVVLAGEPRRLVDRLRGRLWSRVVARTAVSSYKAALQVVTTRLRGGQTELVVLADEAPEPGFAPLPPDLQDVYFAALPDRRPA
jgi:ABC-2 type transport system ATP-binding protein